MKNLGKILTALFLALATMSIMPIATQAKQLAINTPVAIRNEHSLSSSNLSMSQTPSFYIVKDILDTDGNVIIASNTPVYSKVTQVKSRGRIGKPGEIVVSNFYTTTVDGYRVNLSGNASAKADKRMVRSIVLSAVVCPLFLLMRGVDAELPAGTTTTVYVVE